MLDDINLVFLTAHRFEHEQAIRGGLLVTDEQTRPLEFRCTSPIRPNAYQRMLYGDTLAGYVFIDLIGVPLISSAKEIADVVLVDDANFLPARAKVDLPILLVNSSSVGEGSKAVSFKTFPGFENERVAFESRLEALFRNRDPLEPFGRVHLALKEAHAQKIGDKDS
jgi:hypothetical protein